MIRRLSGSELLDQPGGWAVRHSEAVADGRVISMARDTVATPDGGEMVREYVRHPGAVAVIAVDSDDCVVLVQQYRHPVGSKLLEPPAGLLDIAGEPYVVAAQRELAEEAALAADEWKVLLDLVTTPGGSTESVRIFLATGLTPTDRPEGFELEGEEADMDVRRAKVDDLVAALLAGRVQNSLLASGVLALAAARATGATLRDPDVPWPIREQGPDRHDPEQGSGGHQG